MRHNATTCISTSIYVWHIATFGNVCHIATSHCNIWKCLSHCNVTMFCRLQCYYVHNIMTLLCSPYFNTIFSSHCNVMCSSQCDFTMFGTFQCYYVQHIAKFRIFCHITTLQQPHNKILIIIIIIFLQFKQINWYISYLHGIGKTPSSEV